MTDQNQQTSAQKCARCGTASPAGTKFCASCGGSLEAVACSRCKSELRSGARFCDACGTPVGSAGTVARPAATHASATLPWGLISILGAAMLVVVAFAITRSNVNSTPPPAQIPASQQGSQAAITDISNMTPRERADRLYNRVMRARAANDSGEVAFFAPMGIAAYEMMGELDLDARYHVGMISHASGDYDQALEQAEVMEQEVPGHLLATAIRFEVARSRGDEDEASSLLEVFRANYEEQQASGRAEYLDHANTLNSLRNEN